MRLDRWVTGALVLGFLAFGSARAGTLYQADLDGSQETPPNGSTATGHADLYLSNDGTNLRIEVHAYNFTDTITDCHIHRGAPGIAGPVVFAIGAFTDSTTADWALSSSDLSDLNSGLLYVNIHTNLFPGGEIRGQLGLGSSYSLQANLNGSNEVPPTGSLATGVADATIHADGSRLHVDLVVSNMTNTITASHIHEAPPGQNGPVIFSIGAFTTRIVKNFGHPTISQINDLQLGMMYVNVHTNVFPGGEIRGQLLTTSAAGVPPASADGAVLRLAIGQNPAYGSALLRYRLAAASPVRLELFDLGGRSVRVLVDGIRPAGESTALWDGRNERGDLVGSGIYFARVQAGSESSTARVTLVR